jgi:hypothetical protein
MVDILFMGNIGDLIVDYLSNLSNRYFDNIWIVIPSMIFAFGKYYYVML